MYVEVVVLSIVLEGILHLYCVGGGSITSSGRDVLRSESRGLVRAERVKDSRLYREELFKLL